MPAKSVLEPHIDFIRAQAALGKSTKQITEALDPLLDSTLCVETVAKFIRKNNIKLRYSGGMGRGYEPPRCNGCPDKLAIKHVDGTPAALCYKDLRIISSRFHNTSPDWCYKRNEALN